jgi:UDP-hydrolysing UDP-N-acetyl-D-glucosamine 2-epimerase
VPKPKRHSVAIVTGSRADFGLLRPVIDAVRKHPRLRLQLIAAGAHFLPPARTIREVEAAYPIAARVRMQRPGPTNRAADARAVARGIDGFTRAFSRLKPDWVVVLGDRIEAFAAASAASIAGIALAHIHGGDRAEGIADEAMRHAITKLAHLHLAATKQSAQRIVRMGEDPKHVHVVGSPAIDGLARIRPLTQDEHLRVGLATSVFLLHPASGSADQEAHTARLVLSAIAAEGGLMGDVLFLGNFLFLHPNHDPARDGIMRTLQEFIGGFEGAWPTLSLNHAPHLPRPLFVGLLKKIRGLPDAMLIGNSSAGLIEAGAIGFPVVNIGQRQTGRERDGHVINVPVPTLASLRKAIRRARRMQGSAPPSRRFGDGRAGERIARVLASTEPRPAMLRKRNSY